MTDAKLSPLRCLLSRENLNSKFSTSYVKMTITFDVHYRFQENKILQTAHIMNDIPRSGKKVTMEVVPF